MLGLAHQGSLNVSGMGKDLEQAISHFAKTWIFVTEHMYVEWWLIFPWLRMSNK